MAKKKIRVDRKLVRKIAKQVAYDLNNDDASWVALTESLNDILVEKLGGYGLSDDEFDRYYDAVNGLIVITNVKVARV